MKAKSSAFSTAYEAHQGIIHKFARKGYGRLIQAGVVIDYEDVFQEMSMTYVKAAKLYNPERGISFSAYMGRAIWNQFNLFAENEILYKSQVTSIENMVDSLDIEDANLYETVSSDAATPEQYMEVKQDWVTNNMKCGSIAKFIVKQIINPDQGMISRLETKQQVSRDSHLLKQGRGGKRAAGEVSIALIKEYFNLNPIDVRIAKKNLNNVYGKCFPDTCRKRSLPVTGPNLNN